MWLYLAEVNKHNFHCEKQRCAILGRAPRLNSRTQTQHNVTPLEVAQRELREARCQGTCLNIAQKVRRDTIRTFQGDLRRGVKHS